MERKPHRQKKRYGLLIVLTLLNWLILGFMVWKVDPENIRNFLVPDIYLPMLVVVFGALFFLFSILLLSAKRALRWASGFTFYLLLRFLGLGSLLNGMLILGILAVTEVYLTYQEPKTRSNEAKDLTL